MFIKRTRFVVSLALFLSYPSYLQGSFDNQKVAINSENQKLSSYWKGQNGRIGAPRMPHS